jgi:predicted metal-binding protein
VSYLCAVHAARIPLSRRETAPVYRFCFLIELAGEELQSLSFQIASERTDRTALIFILRRFVMNGLVEEAIKYGFSHAALLDTSTLTLRVEARDMCAAGKCKSYNKSWVCPPACGTFEEIYGKLAGYSKGLIVQTTAELEDNFDYESMEMASAAQKERFKSFRETLIARWPRLIALGSGSCKLCEPCTWPDRPCARPDEAIMSMEAAGLIVSDVCKANNINYYYGPLTLTYTSCYILE